MDQERFTRIAKALADPRRFEILKVIAERREMSCGAIAERFPVGQSTVSHHLKILADAGLVSVRRKGQHSFFAARPEVLAEYVRELQRALASARSRPGKRR